MNKGNMSEGAIKIGLSVLNNMLLVEDSWRLR